MDINRCLLSCCLRQRRSDDFEFAYCRSQFVSKKSVLSSTAVCCFYTCVDGVFLEVRVGISYPSHEMQIWVLSRQDYRKICFGVRLAHFRPADTRDVVYWFGRRRASDCKNNVSLVAPLPWSSSGPNAHLSSVRSDTRVCRKSPCRERKSISSVVLLWHVFLLCKCGSRSSAVDFCTRTVPVIALNCNRLHFVRIIW